MAFPQPITANFRNNILLSLYNGISSGMMAIILDVLTVVAFLNAPGRTAKLRADDYRPSSSHSFNVSSRVAPWTN